MSRRRRQVSVLVLAGVAGSIAVAALLLGAAVPVWLIVTVIVLFLAVVAYAALCLVTGVSRRGGGGMAAAALDSMDTSVAVTDGQGGRVLYADTGFAAVVAGSDGVPDALARYFSTDDTGTDGSVEFEALATTALDGGRGRIEAQLPGDRQVSPWFEILTLPGPALGGVDRTVLWQMRDVSDPRNRAEQLGDRLALLSRALDQAPFGLAVLDDQLAVREVNATFRSLIGEAGVTGRPVVDLLCEPNRLGLIDILNQAKDIPANSDPQNGIVTLSMDANPLALPSTTVTINVSPPTRSRGGGGGLLLHLVDATKSRQLEQQFAQSQKMQALGQLAGGVAHDFNNMLTAMIGFCDLILQRHHAGEQDFADIMQIKQNANRAAGLVRQLLAFSRQQPMQPRVLDIGEVLSEISSLLRRVLGERIELSVIHDREMAKVKVDQGQLEQVLINLAVNARDAMNGVGRLEIETAHQCIGQKKRFGFVDVPAGDYVTVTVVDTGPGIPDEIAGRIFDPFFTTKEIGDGTGLGLSMVYGSLEQMGGVVTVRNRPVRDGGGAAFTLFIPDAADAALADDPDADGEGDGGDVTGGGSILLVEDEDPVRLFSARALRSKGYVVTEARTGAAALEILAESTFDLLVTDMMMPEVDGATLIRAAREATPDLPIICISGYTQESVAEEIVDLPNLQFLPKPFSLKQLVGRVRTALEPAGGH
ncbi:MAG: response regulator [Alphaproteobacteria bacterium]